MFVAAQSKYKDIIDLNLNCYHSHSFASYSEGALHGHDTNQAQVLVLRSVVPCLGRLVGAKE